MAKLNPLELEIIVDDNRIERRLNKIRKLIDITTDAFTKLNKEIEKAKIEGLTINFEMIKKSKKWYQIWK